MTSERHGERWLLVRRPLLLLFVLGSGVSLLASGRLTPRLILDGAISFAFVPVLEAGAFAFVYWLGTRRLPFACAMDLFFSARRLDAMSCCCAPWRGPWAPSIFSAWRSGRRS